MGNKADYGLNEGTVNGPLSEWAGEGDNPLDATQWHH